MAETHRVLIVEDDPNIAQMIHELLQVSGSFQTTWASCLQKMWEILDVAAFDLILLDYRLPDGTGLEALVDLNTREVKTPVIMVTAQGNERLAVQALQSGAVNYLVKDSHELQVLPTMIKKAIISQRLQSKLDESNRQVRYQALLLNNVRDAIVVWDTGGFITHINPAAEFLYNLKAKEILGKPVKDCYFSLFRPAIVQPPAESTGGHEISRMFTNSYGEVVWVSSRVNALRDYGDKMSLLGYLDVTRDITSRKQSEDSLRDERNFITAILDTVGALIVVMDAEGRVIRANKTFRQVSGFDFEEIANRPGIEFLDFQKGQLSLYEIYRALKLGKSPVQWESSLLTKKQSPRMISWSTTALRDESGGITNIIATGLDVTEHKKLESQFQTAQAQLAQSSRLAAVGELASGVAHHINNPLTAIIVESQLLNSKLTDDDPFKVSVAYIEEASWRIQQAVQRLLEFSQPPSHAVECVQVNQTIQDTLALIGEYIQSFGIKLVVDLSEPSAIVRGNARKLSDLWLNLILLARDASLDEQTPTITIRTNVLDDGIVRIAVHDDGKPIPEEELASAFETNFFKSLGGRGTGIELNICQEIVRQHQGLIEAASSPDTGTTFLVSIPMET